MLVISTATGDQTWACQSCTYRFPIIKQVNTRTTMKRKEVDDVLGGDEAWENVDQTEMRCPKCDNMKAYWMQLQIRSADEPMTTF
ncbi:dna-directed rna polymerases iii kda polypeptide [Phaffia rhodozyma]|uniref:Dna-directed rna polymerases iii kDa polypeptide n=1 Tax=Phaffia rhodozyma TaxID=264483 RepID=A0A0F7SLS9_PHARH|nr:dna-directed rna polymerases iii kda polypeptide [Phaffia rhodozyma]